MRGFDDAFGHHAWATTRLIDACLALSPEQLATPVPGTYGSILETVRHFVDGDAFYLFMITDDRAVLVDVDDLELAELRAVCESHHAAWSRLLSQELDPDAFVTDVDESNFERDATIGIRLAQALHHGTDHRSQVCTALSTLGVDPPSIDVWDYGIEVGRVVERMPSS